MVAVAGSTCPTCGRLNAPRAGFCGHCGSVLEAETARMHSGAFTAPGPRQPASGPIANGSHRPSPERTGPSTDPSGRTERPGGTTRLLGAAAHLDAELAESFIDEFLVEPRRCIPRSPGVDAGSVLGEAAASHRRRQWRDGLLAVLAVVVMVTFPLFAVGWLVIGGVIAAARGAVGGTRSTTTVVVTVIVGIVGLAVVSGLAAVIATLNSLLTLGAGSSSAYEPESTVTVGGVLGVLAIVAIAVVILGDRLLVVALVRRHFSQHRFRSEPDPDDDGLVASLRTIGRDRFAASLERTRQAEADGASDGLADVVVFRGPEPFVGAGAIVERHALVVPLESEGGGQPSTVSVLALHDAVSSGMNALRRPSSLSPHERLEDLRSHEQVLVSAHDLVVNTASREGRAYLPQGSGAPPVARIPVKVARTGADHPREWARYYRCHYVEGWERDLTVSCYVTFGTDNHLLYLEWVTCALTPLDDSYRVIDDHHALSSAAWSGGFLDVLSFPAGLPSRIGRVFRSFRPVATAPGQVSPAQYGALVSLRELAASGSTDDYFRTIDVRRYASLFDRTVLEAVRTYLAAHGLAIADFDRVASSVINIGSVTDSVVAAGAGARAEGTRPGSSGPAGKKA